MSPARSLPAVRLGAPAALEGWSGQLPKTAIDLGLLTLAFWFSFGLRFDGDIPVQMFKRVVFMWPYVVGTQYFLLGVVGVPRVSWRYFGLDEASRIAAALGCAMGLLLTARSAALAATAQITAAQYGLVPGGVILTDFLLALVALAGARGLWRLVAERTRVGAALRNTPPQQRAIPTLLVGAGDVGVMVLKELARRPELRIKPVGFVDDDRRTHGSTIHGVRVLGPTTDIARLAHATDAERALITIANAPGNDIRRITTLCQQAGLETKIVPSLSDIVGGQVSLTRIRDVAITDLLRREPVVLDEQAIAASLKDRVVMVTGAGGSIGSGLCWQIARLQAKRLVLVERTETALFYIDKELREAGVEPRPDPLIADIADTPRMAAILDAYKPELVFHAAAHKHVPMMEVNPGEAVKNNTLASCTLADLAVRAGVQTFVMISTDKAVNPTSVMGATKRAAEIYMQALSRETQTRFVTVRFGNVLGSSGSVVRIFQEQIARGGPVTVTHPEMTRYFMTIPEACQLVLQAATMGAGGEIFILDMGTPVRIVDLAHDLITLSGLRPGVDVDIVFTSVRPGEKMHEELAFEQEHAERTRHPRIYVGRGGDVPPLQTIAEMADHLRHLAERNATAEMLRGLSRLVPQFRAGAVTEEAAEAQSARKQVVPQDPEGSGPRLTVYSAPLGRA